MIKNGIVLMIIQSMKLMKKMFINKETIIVLYQKKDIFKTLNLMGLINKKIIDYSQDDLIKEFIKN